MMNPFARTLLGIIPISISIYISISACLDVENYDIKVKNLVLGVKSMNFCGTYFIV